MERIRPPFGKVMKSAIHTGETFSHLSEDCSIGSKAGLGTWVPAESGTVRTEGNLPLFVSCLGCRDGPVSLGELCWPGRLQNPHTEGVGA